MAEQKEKLINSPQEAIDTIKSNYPTSGYAMLCEALDMAIEALELREKCSDGRNCTSDCPYNTGKPCPAAEGCPGWEENQ